MAEYYGGRLDDYKYYHRIHRHRNRRHAVSTGFCLITAFFLLLFVALSLPIIKSVYLLQLNANTASDVPATSVGTELRFGVWGFCATRLASQQISFVLPFAALPPHPPQVCS
jgi:uncharacterized BrkB/YihY/UPF0761 family membrane protein